MSIYDRPTRDLMHDFAAQKLKPGQLFSKADAVSWFREHYPKINPITVGMHVEGMSANSTSRVHHPSIRTGLNWDLFFKVGPKQYRLWDASHDPAPVYKDDLLAIEQPSVTNPSDETIEGDAEFALEEDLQRYLVKNLNLLEPGLTLYRDEDGDFDGVEYPVGQRYIDILAVGKDGAFVVIELKVSRGYDRVMGQLLRYMGWIQKNLASGRPVRGIIVASNISDDLKLAASLVTNISLFNYELSFAVQRVPS